MSGFLRTFKHLESRDVLFIPSSNNCSMYSMLPKKVLMSIDTVTVEKRNTYLAQQLDTARRLQNSFE